MNTNFHTFATQAEFSAAQADPRTTSDFGIARDTYQGKWTLRSNRRRSDVFTARELAQLAGKDENGFTVVWEHSGHVQGQALYCRTRYAAMADGGLAGYSSDGTITITHPADREIRIMTR